MSDELDQPVPDHPGQDPDAPQDEPRSDGLGLSDTPHSGFDLGHEDPAEPSSEEGREGA